MTTHIHSRFAVAASLLALAGAGCGSDDNDEPAGPAANAPKATATRDFPMAPDAALAPGVTYVADEFSPKVTFTLPQGTSWATAAPSAEVIDVHIQPSAPLRWSSFAVQKVTQVFDPEKGGRTASDAVEAPPDFAEWLQDHPRLEVTPPVEAQVGGLEGVQIDVTPDSFPRRVPEECSDHDIACVPLLVHDGEPIAYPEGSKTRFYVLDSAEGQVVVESFVDPASEFPKLARTHDQILRSLKLGG